MLIKTAEPNRQIERMLEKSAQRRRLARRQDHAHDASQAVATTMSVVAEVMQEMTAASRILHHAKLHAVPIKPGQNLPPARISRDVRTLTRWNVFGDMFL